MVETQPLPGGKVRVTFLMPAVEGADSLFVVGDFNSWSETATPMSRRADGSWIVAVELMAGSSYQYRFRDDKGRWHDDPSASARAPNPFGGENAVLDLSAAPHKSPREAGPSQPKPEAKRAKKRRG